MTERSDPSPFPSPPGRGPTHSFIVRGVREFAQIYIGREFWYLFCLIILQFLPIHAAEAAPTYPMWDGVETVEAYAKRTNLPPTRTLDLGHSVKMELVLIPAGQFEMGLAKPATPTVTLLSANVLIWIGGAAASILILLLIASISRQRKFSFSLRWLMMITVASGLLAGGVARWRLASLQREQYTVAMAVYALDTADEPSMKSHSVTIQAPFYMGKYPVTQEQYETIIGRNPAQFKGLHNPVERVTWYNAMDYCKKLHEQLKENGLDVKIKLPSEAQWEFACKAGTQTRYYSGDSEKDLSDVAWYESNSYGSTHPVGEKKPNAFGLYDMHGNVWQFCTDLYDESIDADSRAVRGGSWQTFAFHCRSARRTVIEPTQPLESVGLRVIVPLAN